ncbi:MAG: alpha/beta fold hydrolase [Candidatus Omnitrophica bacterium]|nr:alpha/beta fold hydrolase [Candidatus Omnitrophota bacterium]
MEQTNAKFKIYLKGGENAILLVHGITGTPSEMRYLAKSLNKAGYTVLCNTLPHHCGSLEELKKATWQEIAALCIDDFKSLKNEHKKVFVAGLSMGALVSIHIASQFPNDVTGVIAFAPTLFYDGWAVHKGQVLLPLAWHVPYFRNKIDIRENPPYGLKDESLRNTIHAFYSNAAKGSAGEKMVMFGSPFFPLASLYQHHQFAKVVKKELPRVKTPILIMHAKEDDMTSIKNAQYIYKNIASSDKSLIVLENSYHMIVIDKDKERVVDETIRFMNSH